MRRSTIDVEWRTPRAMNAADRRSRPPAGAGVAATLAHRAGARSRSAAHARRSTAVAWRRIRHRRTPSARSRRERPSSSRSSTARSSSSGRRCWDGARRERADERRTHPRRSRRSRRIAGPVDVAGRSTAASLISVGDPGRAGADAARRRRARRRNARGTSAPGPSTRLQQALDEAVEARTPGVLLRAAALAVAGSPSACWFCGVSARARRAVGTRS